MTKLDIINKLKNIRKKIIRINNINIRVIKKYTNCFKYNY